MLAPPEMCLDLELLDFGSAPTSVVKGVARDNRLTHNTHHAEVALHYICHHQSLPGSYLGVLTYLMLWLVVPFEVLPF